LQENSIKVTVINANVIVFVIYADFKLYCYGNANAMMELEGLSLVLPTISLTLYQQLQSYPLPFVPFLYKTQIYLPLLLILHILYATQVSVC